MECPISPKDRVIGYWASPRAQLEVSTSLIGEMNNSFSMDLPNNFSELMNCNPYAGLCHSPSMTAQILANELPSSNVFNPVEQNNGFNPSFGEKVVFEQMDTLLGFLDDTYDANNLNSKQKNNGSCQHLSTFDMENCIISRPPNLSLDERMLKALSFFKESAGGGILAQVWVPIEHGGEVILSTSEQPYLLDQMLAGYREVSRTFTFSAEGKSSSLLGLPGRVFVSKVPEWTSNVAYYNKTEYLRMEHAISHQIRGSIAFPISDLHSELPCCAVLELVTIKEKADFDRELETVCRALQHVNLVTAMPPRLLPQSLSDKKRAALTEIIDVLRSVCHAHRLPVALTWIPCFYTEGAGSDATRIKIKEGHSSSSEKTVLCIEESACYITDRVMEGFVHACSEHHLEDGKGVAGKALQSNQPFFYSDVKAYDISEYPLVHHARKYNLNAAIAIRLRSTYTDCDDYILEFFLPVNMKGSSQQQLLLDNLSGTMQRICTSLRTVSDAELLGVQGSKVESEKKNVSSFFNLSRGSTQIPFMSGNDGSSHNMSLKASNVKNNGVEPSHMRETNASRSQVKKRSSSEKTISPSVLQQYFSGSLKDAAKSLGVCPTTLKRICRQHGISRWPSRKITKVNRSLKKIQTVLGSVQGVEGGLKFDPSMGAFVACGENSTIKLQSDAHDAIANRDETISRRTMFVSDSYEGELKKTNVSTVECSEDSKSMAMDDWSSQTSKGGLRIERSKRNIVRDSSSFLIEDGVVEHNIHPTSSSLTISSNGFDSMIHGGSSSSSHSFENKKHPERKSTIVDSGSRIVVKAAYREDTIRFKFDPSSGCVKLYEEVATRLKLQMGLFQLKYLDDEEEWVMLVNDSDLQECVEILDDIGTRSVKFLVRDMPAPEVAVDTLEAAPSI